MDYLKNFFQKLKDNKLPIAAGGVLALAFTMLDIKLKPETKEKVAEVKKIVKEKMFPKKIKPNYKENIIPVKEDFTASNYIGVTVYIDGERKRLTLSIEQRDKLLGIFGDVEYIKKEGNASQVEVLLMLDCQSKFGENETLYQRCLDLVFEDFQSGEEE